MSAKKKAKAETRSRRLILGNGEAIVGKIEKKKPPFPPPVPPREYEEARANLLPQIIRSLETLRAERPLMVRKEGPILALRIHPDMLAKTYEPAEIFAKIPALQNIGSRKWIANLSEVHETPRVAKQLEEGDTAESRLIFVESSFNGFSQLIDMLNSAESQLTLGFKSAIRKIERFDLLSPQERLSFDPKWKGGRVELVFHPTMTDLGDELANIIDIAAECGLDPERLTVRPYRSGPTFVSTFADRNQIQNISQCNFLRAAHPLRSVSAPTIRSTGSFPIASPTASRQKSTIKVGMFDGGVDTSVPHLREHVEEDLALSCKSTPDPDFVAHGTAVAGALLFGSLDRFDAGDTLPVPNVSVVSVRVFPSSDPDDDDLYEVIDIVEAAVPARPDIQTWNLSLGPPGAITDDPISRFSWTIDELSANFRVTFITAVGNDGDLPGENGRIQAPSDAVHSLGIGAFSGSHISPSRAPYSCRGPGREGGKIKPDFLCFGGCPKKPFQVVNNRGRGSVTMGTSFAAPIASSMHGQLRGRVNQAQPLLARVLMVHSAKHPTKTHCHDFGFGVLPETLEQVLYDDDGEVTIAYQGRVATSAHHRLVIPLPDTTILNGSVSIRFTLGAFCPLDINHLGDYTSCCIVDSFAPHDDEYDFTAPKGMKPVKVRLNIVRAKQEAQKLLGLGYKQSQLPSMKGLSPKNEAELRRADLKWDTIIRRHWGIQSGSSLFKPSIYLHAMHRRDRMDVVEYAAAVTLSAKKYTGDLHSEITSKFPVLSPINVRSEAEVRVSY